MAVTAEAMKQGKSDANQFKQLYEQRQAANQATIGNQMDSTLSGYKNDLLNTYNQNVATENETAALGRKGYEAAGADVTVQGNRTQTGMDQFADVRGLNRTTGSQQDISLGLGARRAMRNIAERQAAAEAETQVRLQQLATQYNNDVQVALANHDYRKAAALLDEYNRGNTWLENNAPVLAGYGNYAGYEQLYGPEVASMMQTMWNAQNPDQAYNLGLISPADYEKMTGKKPPDYVAPVSGGGWGWYGGGYGGSAAGTIFGAPGDGEDVVKGGKIVYDYRGIPNLAREYNVSSATPRGPSFADGWSKKVQVRGE